ncbi:MAG: hypothetical protein RL060_258 [Bacteroidota bacterium]
MNKAYIIGASGHGNVIAAILHQQYDEIVFVDMAPKNEQTIAQDYFLEHIQIYRSCDIYLGIGNNGHRIALFNKLKSHGITPSNCIASHTFIAHDAVIGSGVVICPGAIIGSKAIIGDNTIVNTLSSIDHDCVLGNHSQVAPGVNFGGNTIVGENCFIGIKSATIPNINIGNNAIVMAGSTVCHHVDDNTVVGGTPAKFIKVIIP